MIRYLLCLCLATLLPMGALQAQIPIATFAELELIGQHEDYPLSGDYILVADIDASLTADPEYNDGAGWLPIGVFDDQFTGTFDGDGHTISGLYANAPSNSISGFFGFVDTDAEVKNLHLVDFYVAGSAGVGGLTAVLWGTITNCSVSGTTAGSPGGYSAGGMVGIASTDSTIVDSHSAGTVEGGWEVGGLVGSLFGGILSGSHSTADVTAREGGGGLVGLASGQAVITESNSSGRVEGVGHGFFSVVGGLVGQLAPPGKYHKELRDGKRARERPDRRPRRTCRRR